MSEAPLLVNALPGFPAVDCQIFVGIPATAGDYLELPTKTQQRRALFSSVRTNRSTNTEIRGREGLDAGSAKRCLDTGAR